MTIIDSLRTRVSPLFARAPEGAFGHSHLDDVRADAARYPKRWYLEPGFWVTATYRWGRWARTLQGPIRLAALVPQKMLNQYFHIILQVDISPHAEIGPGLCLIHPRNITIGGCKIGKNCLIFQEVTLGMDANSYVFPELGDDIDIYAGARVIGQIRLGNGVKVGANCVVSQSVGDGCTVVVAKNRVIPRGLVEAFGPRRSAQRAKASPKATEARENTGVSVPSADVPTPPPAPREVRVEARPAREQVEEAVEPLAE